MISEVFSNQQHIAVLGMGSDLGMASEIVWNSDQFAELDLQIYLKVKLTLHNYNQDEKFA